MPKPLPTDIVCQQNHFNSFPKVEEEKSCQFDVTVYRKKKHSALANRRSMSLGDEFMLGREEYFL